MNIQTSLSITDPHNNNQCDVQKENPNQAGKMTQNKRESQECQEMISFQIPYNTEGTNRKTNLPYKGTTPKRGGKRQTLWLRDLAPIIHKWKIKLHNHT